MSFTELLPLRSTAPTQSSVENTAEIFVVLHMKNQGKPQQPQRANLRTKGYQHSRQQDETAILHSRARASGKAGIVHAEREGGQLQEDALATAAAVQIECTSTTKSQMTSDSARWFKPWERRRIYCESA